MFGTHTPIRTVERGTQSPMAVFTRGLQIGGTIWTFEFDNGYGASVINDGYGREQGLYELGVLAPDGHLTYRTPVTDDVLGCLTPDEVAAALDQIEALTEESIVQAQIDRERKKRDDRIAELEQELADLKRQSADQQAALDAVTR